MSKKKKTIIIVALLLVVFIGSISYALWSVTLEQTGSNVVKTGCFTVDMVEETDEINLPEEYPVLDSVGNNYSPFTFTIQNTCNIDSSYSVNLKVDTEKSSLNRDSVKVSLNKGTPQILTDYETAADEEKYQLTTGTLAGASTEGGTDGESVTYDLRLWLDENTSKDEMSKDFYAKIVVENITTSGVEAKEVLATADISEAQDGSMAYTYYSTGELEISGTGRMADVDGYSLAINILRVMSQGDSEFAQSLTEEEKSLILNVTDEDTSFYILSIKLNGNYEAANLMLSDGITEITNFESYYSSVSNLQPPAELLTLLDKMNQYLPEINGINIDEGVESLSSNSLAFIKTDELVMPSTMIEIESSALMAATTNVKFNDTLQTLGKIMLITDNIIEIPNSVTKFSGTTGNIPMTIKLPKNDTYTTLGTYTFDNSENITLIIPDTITKIEYYAFASSKNFTLNFECSEENKPEGIGLDEAISKGFVLNYNYEYDFGA